MEPAKSPATPARDGTRPAEAAPLAMSPPSLEELLRERIRLDAQLQQQVRRDVTLLFTDIQDATLYFEPRGDRSGRQLIQRHNDLVLPVVEQHHGTVLQTIGEAMMASFPEATAAVQSAIAMQRVLRDYNSGQEVSEQIHLRIGINSGQTLVETHDLFGEVVHVASRVESCALPDQILISNATYDRLLESIPCRYLGATEVHGKTIPIELYEVHWDERRTIQETVLLRGPGVMARPGKIFVLDVSRDGDRLRLSAHERWPGEERPVRHYEHLDVALETLAEDVEAMVRQLHQAASGGGSIATADWQDIKARGAALYQQLLTSAIQDQLRTTTATDLFLYLDAALVQVPWELLYDGQTFLCRRFSMGRIVNTPQALVDRQERQQAPMLSLLIVADPQGNLPAAAREGTTIKDALVADAERLQITVRRNRVSTGTMQAALARYDVVHYAGHADYDLHEPALSGWRLADGKLTARQIVQSGEAAPMPALVFGNACQSGHTEPWAMLQDVEQGVYGLANAFLLAGTQHYIGSFWDLPDQPGAAFAVAFYRALAQGSGVGEALRSARQSLAERYGEAHAVWASYVLYGDPTVRYLQVSQADVTEVEESETVAVLSRGEATRPPRQTSRLVLGLGALLVLGLLLVLVLTGRLWTLPGPDTSPIAQAYQILQQQDLPQAESLFQQLSSSTQTPVQGQALAGLAALAFTRGDYQQALDFAAQAERVEPEIVYSHVIRGHIAWNQGKTAEAAAAYHTATEKSLALPWQQAVAYDRLGRLYAAQGETSKAMEHYDKAIDQQQDMATVYANKGYLLAQLGNLQEALGQYQKALEIDPADALTTMLLRDAERRQQLAEDRQQQQHIDRLVDELVQAYNEGGKRAVPGDGWTSRPLTLAFLDFQHQGGLSARAGEEEFVILSLSHALRTSRRVAIVEREVLHKVLTELKLNASDLVDSQSGLGQGKILAARLLATGTLSRFGKTGLCSIRLIETETTLVNAAAMQSVETPDDISTVVEHLAQSLLQDIRRAYPLQGFITSLAGLDHGIGHFRVDAVDSVARAVAPPIPKSTQTSSVASDQKTVPLQLSRQSA